MSLSAEGVRANAFLKVACSHPKAAICQAPSTASPKMEKTCPPVAAESDASRLVQTMPTKPASTSVILGAGAISGALSRTLTAPLDRLKTLMQMSPRVPSAPCVRGGVVVGLSAIYSHGGVRALFQGNGANVIKSMPEFAVKFWAYDTASRALCRDPRRMTLQERLVAGAFAGAASCVCVYPLEVAKTRMAVAPAHVYSSVAHCLRLTLRAEGARGLFKGLGASLVGIIPFSAIDLALYSCLKDTLSRRNGDSGSVSSLDLLACGAVSSCVAQSATYPLALARTRMQTAGMPGNPVAFASVADCLRATVRAEGVCGLFRGMSPNLLKAVPAMSISYVVFENTKMALSSLAR